MELEICNLQKSFGETDALRGISFRVKECEAFGIVGRNGAGKTTTIRSILGIINQDHGDILINGKDIRKQKIKFGYLPEERGLYAKCKVSDQLLYLAKLNGVEKAEAKKNLINYLDKFNIPQYYNKKVEELSKGNKQKVQLIAAIQHNPDIIILDEPFSGLDPVNVSLFEKVIKGLITERKIIIFSCHQMSYVEEICKNIVMLKSGQIILEGSLDGIKEKYYKKRIRIKTNSNLDKIIDAFKLVKIEHKQGSYILEFKEKNQVTLLLNNMIKGNMYIEKFEYLKPSLNEIFIRELGD